MSIEIDRGGNAGGGREGGENIDELDNSPTRLSVSRHPGNSDDQWRSRRLLEKRSLLPNAPVFPEMITMITPEHDDSLFRKRESVESVQKPTDLRIDE